MKQLLLKQFENVDRMKIFEIDIAEALPINLEIENEYYLFQLNADINGVSAGSITNTGFYQLDNLFVEWDEYYSLDEHLEFLYDKCYEWAIKNFEEETKC